MRKPSDITRIIVHCSDSPNDRDIGVKEIREWHRSRGFRDIGYHFVIRRNGEVEPGRLIKTVGAHCVGFNSDSIGVCLVGKDSFTPAQFNALRALVATLRKDYPIQEIKGHREYLSAIKQGKTCPNFNVKDVL
jgi:N-acetylmuramoyl-L-alanine amidase